MTNEEAIMILKAMIDEMILVFDRDRKKALNMAIEALKEQPEHSQNAMSKQPDLETLGVKTGKTCADAISRQDAIEELSYLQTYLFDSRDHDNKVSLEDVRYAIEQLPSAEPEQRCVNCGRTANNGGWYADGRTRCPIEEHYALPKDGYCHLWEKRNVSDDDYPERRTDE